MPGRCMLERSLSTPFVKVTQDKHSPSTYANGATFHAHVESVQQIVSHLAGLQATGPLVEQPIEYFQQVMDTNLTGAVRMTQAIVPAMLARVITYSSFSP